MLQKGTIVGGAWRIESFIGEGACAKIYSVTGLQENVDVNEFVLKAIHKPTGSKTSKSYKEQERICNTLFYEYTLYAQLLYHFPYRPALPSTKFYGEDNEKNIRFMVMERLDEDLIHLSNRQQLDKRTVGLLGLQILDGLQYIHGRNYVYVDIKPDNFMMKENKLRFIDFGLMQSCPKENTTPKIAIDYSDSNRNTSVAGTPTFVSLAVHFGSINDRKDDIESMAYALISLFNKGKLPWSNARTALDCRNMKRDYPLNQLSIDFGCPQLVQIVQECRAMEMFEIPDYDRIRSLLLDFQASQEDVSTHSSKKIASIRPIQDSGASSRVKRVKKSVEDGEQPASRIPSANKSISVSKVPETPAQNSSINNASHLSTSSKLSEIISSVTFSARNRVKNVTGVIPSNDENLVNCKEADTDEHVFSGRKELGTDKKITKDKVKTVGDDVRNKSKTGPFTSDLESNIGYHYHDLASIGRYTLRSGRSFNSGK